MRKIWLVFKREYLTRVRTKAFVLGTIALPLSSLGLLAIAVLASNGNSSHTIRIAIVDETGGVGHAVAENLMDSDSNGQPAIEITEFVKGASPRTRSYLVSQVRRGDLDAFLTLPSDVLTGKAPAALYARNYRAALLLGQVQQAVNNALISSRLASVGNKAGDIKPFKLAHIHVVNISAHGGRESNADSFATAIILGILLYMTLIIYGTSTMRSVMEEKSTRIIEILVSSVNPFNLLSGKILSVAAVAVTQYAIWAITIGALLAYSSGLAQIVRPGASGPSFHLPASLLVYLVVFFLAGYFLYASLYAVAGAIVSTDEEARQVQLPLTLLIMCSFLLFNVIFSDPASPLSVVLSITPFLSPILMTLRIAIQPPPFWQVALALALSAITTLVIIRLSAKIYRVGILMYGKRPSLRELRRWLRYT